MTRVDTNVDPVTGIGADLTVVNGMVQPLPMPAATPANEATTMGMESNQPLTSSRSGDRRTRSTGDDLRSAERTQAQL